MPCSPDGAGTLRVFQHFFNLLQCLIWCLGIIWCSLLFSVQVSELLKAAMSTWRGNPCLLPSDQVGKFSNTKFT